MNLVQAKYRTFRPRFFAAWVDGIILSPVGFAYLWIDGYFLNRLVLALAYVCYSVIFTLYSVLLHGFFGQTIGKRLCGVVVLDLSEARLSMKQAIIRDCPCIFAMLIGLPFGLYRIWQGVDVLDPDHETIVESVVLYMWLCWFLAEFVTMLSNPMRRAIHDYIAGSVVVRSDEIGPSPFFS